MKLLTKENRQSLPALYATEEEKDPTVCVKFFSPWLGWTWYATEFDGKNVFFGLVEGFETEWGYFSLSELDSLRGPCGVPAVERDMHFDPVPVSRLKLREHSRVQKSGHASDRHQHRRNNT